MPNIAVAARVRKKVVSNAHREQLGSVLLMAAVDDVHSQDVIRVQEIGIFVLPMAEENVAKGRAVTRVQLGVPTFVQGTVVVEDVMCRDVTSLPNRQQNFVSSMVVEKNVSTLNVRRSRVARPYTVQPMVAALGVSWTGATVLLSERHSSAVLMVVVVRNSIPRHFDLSLYTAGIKYNPFGEEITVTAYSKSVQLGARTVGVEVVTFVRNTYYKVRFTAALVYRLNHR